MKMHHPYVTHARHTLALVVATVLCRLACGGVDGGGEAARSNCIRGKPIAARYTHRPKRLCVKYTTHWCPHTIYLYPGKYSSTIYRLLSCRETHVRPCVDAYVASKEFVYCQRRIAELWRRAVLKKIYSWCAHEVLVCSLRKHRNSIIENQIDILMYIRMCVYAIADSHM